MSFKQVIAVVLLDGRFPAIRGAGEETPDRGRPETGGASNLAVREPLRARRQQEPIALGQAGERRARELQAAVFVRQLGRRDPDGVRRLPPHPPPPPPRP